MSIDFYISPEGREAVMTDAARFLVARLASSEDAIAVALEIARCENHVPEARAAALRSIARLMASAATIANSLARMNGTTHDQRVTVEHIGERIGGDKFETLSPRKTAETREKLKAYPRGEGAPKKNSVRNLNEPSPHLWPARHRAD